MFCQLCLSGTSKLIDIFGDEGVNLKISSIIGQHFWFEPKVEDSENNLICNACWWRLDSFHSFYSSVKEAHSNFDKILANQSKFDDPVRIETKPCFTEAEIIEPLEINKVHVESETDGKTSPVCTQGEANKSESQLLNSCLFKDVDSTPNYCPLEEPSGSPQSEEPKDYETPTENLGLSDQDVMVFRNKRKVAVRLKRSLKKNNNVNDALCSNDDGKDRQLLKESEYLRRSKENDEKIAKHMKLKCELCGSNFITFAEVRRHYRTVHKRKGYVVCCNKKLFKRVLILDHINKHLNPDYFKCHDCNRVFADKQCLKNHMIRHESEDVKIFKCDVCSRRYARQYLLEQHKLTHIPEEEREYFCDECSKAFPTKNLLQTHKRYVHENVYGKMCHVCAKVIKGKALFEKHQLEHAGIIEPKVQCQQCGAWLKHEYSLKKHLRRHQEELSPHVCNLCGKSAPSKGALRSHIRYVHSSERTFQCSICNKSFKKALALKEHMTIHTGEVLYTCPHCPKTFNHSANMHSHRKKAHRQEWEESRKNRGAPKEYIAKNDNAENLNEDIPCLIDASTNVTTICDKSIVSS